MSPQPPAIVMLISGRGSNLQAIIDAAAAGKLGGEVRLVISNNPEAQGLEVAKTAGVPFSVIDHRHYDTREDFERALSASIDRCRPKLVALAGFMRMLTPTFVAHYAGRLINIHPSLLPEYPGLKTHERALRDGASEHGASVHFVVSDLDAGPVIVQARVPVKPGDDPPRLAARVLTEEHRIYPLAISWFLAGRLTTREGRVLLDGRVRPEQGFSTPTGSRE